MSLAATLPETMPPLTTKALGDAISAGIGQGMPHLVEMDEVDQHIDGVLDRRHPRFAGMVEQVRHFRGKRFRPLLVLLTAKALGKVDGKHPILGAVMELIHTATLVHDDVLDGAQMRRHNPTVNSRYDNYNSVMLGDWIFSQAFALASELDNQTINKSLAESACKVCEGELLQGLERGNLDLDEATYFKIIDGKTAELLAACCRCAAVLSGATESQVHQMDLFGRKVGLAFQVADDLLDLVGEESKTGKSLGTDLQQAKLTLPMIHGLRQKGGAQIRQLLEAPPADPSRARALMVDLLTQTGSLVFAKDYARKMVGEARAALLSLPPSPWRQHLAQLAEKAVARSA